MIDLEQLKKFWPKKHFYDLEKISSKLMIWPDFGNKILPFSSILPEAHLEVETSYEAVIWGFYSTYQYYKTTKYQLRS